MKNEGSAKSRYEKPQEIKLNEKEAKEIKYEVYQEIPRGPLFVTKYWLKAKFIVVKAKEGFYALAYKSPQSSMISICLFLKRWLRHLNHYTNFPVQNVKYTGSVSVKYTNQRLQKRLLSSKPVNTSNDL